MICIGKSTLLLPAGMVTWLGTVAAELLFVKVTTAPPAGAALFRLNLPVIEL